MDGICSRAARHAMPSCCWISDSSQKILPHLQGSGGSGSWQLCQQNNSNGPANCCLIDSGAAINQLEVAANLATQLRNKESEATVLTCLLLLFLLLLWLYALVLSHVLFFSVFPVSVSFWVSACFSRSPPHTGSRQRTMIPHPMKRNPR